MVSYIVSMKYSQGLFSSATWKLWRLADSPTGTALKLRLMISISIPWYLACWCCAPAGIIVAGGNDTPPPLDELTLLDWRLVDPPESELGALLNTGSLVLLLRLLPDNTTVWITNIWIIIYSTLRLAVTYKTGWLGGGEFTTYTHTRTKHLKLTALPNLTIPSTVFKTTPHL